MQVINWLVKKISSFFRFKRGYGNGRDKVYQLDKIFTPSSPAQDNYVPRAEIEKLFKRSLKTRGRQIVVYGYSGVGKSSLVLNSLKEAGIDWYNSETDTGGDSRLRYIICNCVKQTSIQDLIKNAFEQLGVFYKDEKSSDRSTSSKSQAKILAPGGSAERTVESEQRTKEEFKIVTPPELTPQNLAKYLGETGILWIIEDFQNVQENERATIIDIVKIFSDQSVHYKDLKIICIGAESTARQIVDFDEGMKERVVEIQVPLFEVDQVYSIVKSGFRMLNIEIADTVAGEIAKYSNSVAAVAHSLCLSICQDFNIDSTCAQPLTMDNVDMKTAINSYILNKKLAFKQTLDKVVRPGTGMDKSKELILKAMLSLDNESVRSGEILDRIISIYPEFNHDNLDSSLKKLTGIENDEILIYDKQRKEYRFKNPLFKAFTRLAFDDKYQGMDLSSGDDIYFTNDLIELIVAPLIK